jgi:hypothetical protein
MRQKVLYLSRRHAAVGRNAFCMAVGHQVVSGRGSTLAEYWNGTTWKILPTPR